MKSLSLILLIVACAAVSAAAFASDSENAPAFIPLTRDDEAKLAAHAKLRNVTFAHSELTASKYGTTVPQNADRPRLHISFKNQVKNADHLTVAMVKLKKDSPQAVAFSKRLASAKIKVQLKKGVRK